jgi:hypothetical protein
MENIIELIPVMFKPKRSRNNYREEPPLFKLLSWKTQIVCSNRVQYREKTLDLLVISSFTRYYNMHERCQFFPYPIIIEKASKSLITTGLLQTNTSCEQRWRGGNFYFKGAFVERGQFASTRGAYLSPHTYVHTFCTPSTQKTMVTAAKREPVKRTNRPGRRAHTIRVFNFTTL